MDKLILKPFKFIIPLRLVTLNVIIYLDINKGALLNEGKCNKIK